MERAAAAVGKDLAAIPREEMEQLWQAAKRALDDKEG
jgi:hypothetical protein